MGETKHIRHPIDLKFDAQQLKNLFNYIISGSICADHGSRFPTFVRRLQLSQSIRLVDWHARSYVLLLVQGILQIII